MPILNESFAILAILLVLIFGSLWLIQQRTKNANSVDVAWSLSFTLVAIVGVCHFWGHVPLWRLFLVAGLVATWSLRLGIFLLRSRILNGKSEDSRYLRLRNELNWGAAAFLGVYLMQVVLILILTGPIWLAMASPSPQLRSWDFFAVFVFLVSITGETLADRQLETFKSDPRNRGRTCQQGLWRYSRHPNYFFEWIHWWSYVFFAVGSSYWIWSWLAPGVMWIFLTRLTGIPATERQALRSRSDYSEYQRMTRPFVPWFRRKGS